jgi:hypothetical protein
MPVGSCRIICARSMRRCETISDERESRQIPLVETKCMSVALFADSTVDLDWVERLSRAGRVGRLGRYLVRADRPQLKNTSQQAPQ